MEQVKFSILISTKNRKDDLLLTLQKTQSLIYRNDTECVVFDDGSNDGTFEMVRDNFPKVTLWRNEVSKGYIFCRNKMLNETKAEFAISLDDDAHFLSENPLAEIESYFDANPQCGLIAFRIYWSKMLPNNTKTKEIPQCVKGFVGCGHAWRMKAWCEIPPYPEWFGFYGEEDFASFQLFKKQWQVHYLPTILIQHRVDMNSRKGRKEFNFRYRHSLRNGWHAYFLFYPTIKIPKKMAYSLSMQLKKIMMGNVRIAVPLFRAKVDVLAAIPDYYRNRNAFSKEEYAEFSQLSETKIYWRPEETD